MSNNKTKEPLIIYSTNFKPNAPTRLYNVAFFNNAMVTTCSLIKQHHIRVIRQNHRKHKSIMSITVVLVDGCATSFRLAKERLNNDYLSRNQGSV